MKKFFKCSTIVLTLALCLGIAAFATGCGEKDENATDYTIKLVYEDGSAYTDTNTEVQICVMNNDSGEIVNCTLPKKIDANGVGVITAKDLAGVELEDGQSYHIQINKLSEGCSYDTESKDLVVSKPGTTTIKIKKA